VPALSSTDDFTASRVVTQSIGYYIHWTAWFATAIGWKIMDCKADLMQPMS